jgi:Mg2+ and Co2+ transporter CorA
MAGLREPMFLSFEKEVVQTDNKVKAYTDEEMIKPQIKEERVFIHDICDVRDELAMIKSVVLQQEDVWKKFGKFGSFDISRTTQTQEQLEQFKKRICRIGEDTTRVQERISMQLDLIARFAALKESHNSTVLSTAVIGFTVITVVFTPLAFLTSLFALLIHQLQNHQTNITVDGPKGYSKAYIGRWMREFRQLFSVHPGPL